MKFREAPVGAILVVGYTADGPVLARKLEDSIDNGHVVSNACWVDESGDTRGTCVIMDDQECEVVTLPKPVEPRRSK